MPGSVLAVRRDARRFIGTGFGGFKDSGIGREENLDELLSWTQSKDVSVLFGTAS